MKRYTFEVVIDGGGDEFWEEIDAKKKTGCDEVRELVKIALADHGLYADDDCPNCTITLKKFEEIEE